MNASSERIVPVPLYEEVADRLRVRIYRGQLRPGEWVDERGMCEALGISRTPLREALKVLAAEGLVVLQPRRGCQVRRLEPCELDELFPVMAVLEGMCARAAAAKCTEAELAELEASHGRLESLAAACDIDGYYEENRRFHRQVQRLARNRWLERVTADLRRMLLLVRHRQLTAPGRLAESLAEHRRIMDAFRTRNADLADSRMNQHLMNQWKALSRLEPAPEPAQRPEQAPV